MGGASGGFVNHSLPPYKPAAKATSVQTANTTREVLAPDPAAVAGTVEDKDPESTAEDDAPETAPDARESLDIVSDTTDVRDESMDRLIRLRSARSSAAVWQRSSGSFSNALLIVSSNFNGS